MSLTVWKYVLDPFDTVLSMPQGARLVHVHNQGPNLCVWAEVNPRQPIVGRQLHVVPTGGDAIGHYVGTVHLHGGTLVFHIYDAGEVTP